MTALNSVACMRRIPAKIATRPTPPSANSAAPPRRTSKGKSKGVVAPMSSSRPPRPLAATAIQAQVFLSAAARSAAMTVPRKPLTMSGPCSSATLVPKGSCQGRRIRPATSANSSDSSAGMTRGKG